MGHEINVELYPEKIKQLVDAYKKAFELTVEAVLTDIKTSATVPKQDGTLEGSGFTSVDAEKLVGSIIFDTPYARRLYWHPEYNFRTDKNVNAGGMWMQTYIDGSKKGFVRDTFGIFLKQCSGGLVK